MNKSVKKFLTDWGIPLVVILVLYFTGWYKPLAVGVQRAVLMTGFIKPTIALEADGTHGVIDYNWQLQEIGNDAILSLEELRGKVIFLNYFATWCPPCIAEMPGIQGLYDELGNDSRFAFIIVSRDDSMEKARNFMSDKGYSMPVYSSVSRVPAMLHSNVLPTTFIIAPDGSIVSTHEGMADYDNESVREALRKLAENR